MSASQYALCRLCYLARPGATTRRVTPPMALFHIAVGAVHTSLYTSRVSAASTSHASTAGVVDCYKRLQITPQATAEEVKSAYRRLALEWHPDVVSDEQRTRAEVQFRAISEAYEVLSDPVRRRAHDHRLGLTQASSTEASASSSSLRSRKTGDNGSGRGYSSAGVSARPVVRPAASPLHQATPGRKTAKDRPFVRGDANRVFADAFDGKSLQQLLFEAQRRRRQERAADLRSDNSPRRHDDIKGNRTSCNDGNKANHHNPMGRGNGDTIHSCNKHCNAGKATNRTLNNCDDGSLHAAGTKSGLTEARRKASLQHVLYHAAETFAARAQKLYGPGLLGRIRVRDGTFGLPGLPPQAHMPFRPFVHTPVPTGVSTPPDPVMGPLSHVDDAGVEEVERVCADKDGQLSGATGVSRRFECRLRDGTRLPQNVALARSQREIQGAAHNMGQLYSYHRPY